MDARQDSALRPVVFPDPLKRLRQQLAAGGALGVDVTRAFADDRQVVVGTTDYDLASGRVWSLNNAFDTTTAGLARSTPLLKAATAITGIFLPVMLKGHLHDDGGVITTSCCCCRSPTPSSSHVDRRRVACPT